MTAPAKKSVWRCVVQGKTARVLAAPMSDAHDRGYREPGAVATQVERADGQDLLGVTRWRMGCSEVDFREGMALLSVEVERLRSDLEQARCGLEVVLRACGTGRTHVSLNSQQVDEVRHAAHAALRLSGDNCPCCPDTVRPGSDS